MQPGVGALNAQEGVLICSMFRPLGVERPQHAPMEHSRRFQEIRERSGVFCIQYIRESSVLYRQSTCARGSEYILAPLAPKPNQVCKHLFHQALTQQTFTNSLVTFPSHYIICQVQQVRYTPIYSQVHIRLSHDIEQNLYPQDPSIPSFFNSVILLSIRALQYFVFCVLYEHLLPENPYIVQPHCTKPLRQG